MQAYRQQQQQQQQIVLQEHRLQGEPCKDRLGGGSGSMSSISPTPKLQVPNNGRFILALCVSTWSWW